MSMTVRRTYGVPAKVGQRIRYTGGNEPRMGTIRSAEGAHSMIQLDGDRHTTGPYHPTWKIEYVSALGEPRS